MQVQEIADYILKIIGAEGKLIGNCLVIGFLVFAGGHSRVVFEVFQKILVVVKAAPCGNLGKGST